MDFCILLITVYSFRSFHNVREFLFGFLAVYVPIRTCLLQVEPLSSTMAF